MQLVCLPMHDLEENAAIVNALQRHATIVTQKSLAEGFGLTVAEAMLKGRPSSRARWRGIVDQIVDGETGRLVDDPTDLEGFGTALCAILDDHGLQIRLGEGARRRAVDVHLGDTHLESWVGVVGAVLGDGDRTRSRSAGRRRNRPGSDALLAGPDDEGRRDQLLAGNRFEDGVDPEVRVPSEVNSDPIVRGWSISS